jgi:hypothetical protein
LVIGLLLRRLRQTLTAARKREWLSFGLWVLVFEATIHQINMNFEKLSDKELYTECKKWGHQVLEAKYKFEGLLPEVNRRRLYERRGFKTIYDFARLLAGLSRDQVNRVFSVNKKLENKPVLHKLFVEGEISVNKLSRIISIATSENQDQLVKAVTTLSQRALEIKVREIRQESAHSQIDIFENENGLGKHSESVHVHKSGSANRMKAGVANIDINLKMLPKSRMTNLNRDLKLMQILNDEMKEKLLELSEKGHDINELLFMLLEKREVEIEQKMVELGQKQAAKESGKASTRHIPIQIQKAIKEKYGTKCSAPGCEKMVSQLHHEKPYAIFRTHDPGYIKPLCRGHHELKHAQV